MKCLRLAFVSKADVSGTESSPGLVMQKMQWMSLLYLVDIPSHNRYAVSGVEVSCVVAAVVVAAEQDGCDVGVGVGTATVTVDSATRTTCYSSCRHGVRT